MEQSYCQFSNSGGSWLSFPEPEDDSESEGENNNGLDTRHATLLPKNEMQLYGHCPAHDNFTLVTCDECGKILKISLFTRHCELYHKNLLSTLPSHKTSEMRQKNKHMKVLQPKVVINKLNPTKMESMDVDTIEVKIEEVPPIKVESVTPEPIAITPTNAVTNHALKKGSSLKKSGKDTPKKFVLTKDREYDPNRHCGVWVSELQKNCTRSLTCKTHALSLRRAVPGRIKDFDSLLLEHRERVNIAKEQQLLSKAHSSGGSSGSKFTDQRNSLANQSFGGGQFNKDVSSSLAFKSQHSNLDDDQSDLQYLNAHPKPLACCRFGSRRAGAGHFVFNRRSDHLRTTVLSMVERLLHPTQSRQTVGKHSVHRRYTTKTAGQSSNQGSGMRTDTSSRSRTASAAPNSSTVFRNSSKHKTARQSCSERGSQSNRTTKTIPNVTVQLQTTSQQTATQRSCTSKGNAMNESPSILTSQNIRAVTGETCGGTVTTTELESSLTLGKDLGIADPTTVSVILNGPITSGDLLANRTQTSGGSTKNCSQVPSPRGSYVIPASPSSPASVVYSKNNQVVNPTDVASGISTAMSPPTVYQRQTSSGSQQLSALVNGTAPSPPAGTNVKGYTTNIAPKTSHVNTKGVPSNPGHSVSNFIPGQTLVFANTNISQLQGQPISQPLTTQISQDKTHAQNKQFQRPLASPGRTSCQPASPQIPSPGRQSPQRSPSNAASPKYQQHSMYLNHQHVPVATQAPIAQLKQQVENQGQQLQQIKFQQLQQQQQSHNPQRQQQNDPQTQPQQHVQHQKQPQFRAQQRIAPAPIQAAQQTTYLLPQSQPNHTLSLRPANGQVLKPTNTVFITNDNPPREIQFSLSRNAANTVG